MTTPTEPHGDEFRKAADELAAEAGSVIGYQRARLGADRLTAIVEGHGKLQAMTMFLLMSVMTVPQTGYTDEALDALREDARDVRQAAAEWAKTCERLADHWQAQRQEHR